MGSSPWGGVVWLNEDYTAFGLCFWLWWVDAAKDVEGFDDGWMIMVWNVLIFLVMDAYGNTKEHQPLAVN